MIYFIQSASGPIKIGFTQSVPKRFQTLQTSSSEKLFLLAEINGNKTLERDIHNRFVHLKLNGEWFKPEQEIFDFIKEVSCKPITVEKHVSKAICLPTAQKALLYLGENIKLARLRRKLTASQVAERAGITRVTLRNIENGEAGCSIGNIANVLFTLGLIEDLNKVALDDIFGRKLQDIALQTKK